MVDIDEFLYAIYNAVPAEHTYSVVDRDHLFLYNLINSVLDPRPDISIALGTYRFIHHLLHKINIP